MKIHKDYNLSGLNTFGLAAKAKFFAEVNNEEELRKLFVDPLFTENTRLFLGKGSNILFTKDFDGIVILNKIQGIEVLRENTKTVLVKSMSGVIWHDLVVFTTKRGYWGIENLSLIPGTVGAAPMQNIGAYGAELRNVLESVETFDVKTGEKRIFNKEECEFGYRDSIFKNKLKNRYFISAVVLKLSKFEKKNLTYKILADYLNKNKVEVKNSSDISKAVAEIRCSKLPDPKLIGNAGSFFKNVFVGENKFNELMKIFPDMPHFEEDNMIKVPAGWLIEQCGWKGKRVGNVGVHERQALVLVNYGEATGREIIELANKIIASVKEKFGLELTPEVNIV
ncbi:TPA: UDP-N-acetylenolpyruvoylglucosamine reductase [Candidatus Nomurabacteria bacterium]|uniref:UDP-N-acetylenolpyruvoylglucosamine reductase n=2 Tax=Candidatus Nomuraibacteriota TaxID=1752729 RepID=A0A1F6YQ36_9BACT|nr:MAG: UDP-N-acetylenolpyruvoylglucosamine reductase [Parcubacteria group bacterium GW2011_GWC1_42_21]KKS58091.1 MAG: UDP-N-acetylenolpyruvoylglucosamine reductase [Candidatus Nomurabacteria bacterium GW2011_GWF1_42_40]KKS99510.1 MAG: UDP-N-acetylenolpyruvoylglucosamine reductase [Candidatus Nomurabacteria bacterium GW2011_GWA1_43_17]KKT06346.1 MAG: UDP-N-acetylenolpyruvoylglucosamine reductase [Candidatus Nomurabacteria bacterium GW2011_GWB1_43_19]KKT10552.1 MAG: UDP-N-acetylenolpyruvoylgluco